VERFGLAEIVERLAKQDEAVLVRELAKEVIPILLFGNTASVKEDAGSEISKPGSAAVGIMGLRGGTGMRRTTSEAMLNTGGSGGVAMSSDPSVVSGLNVSTTGREGISAPSRVSSQRNRRPDPENPATTRLVSSGAGPSASPPVTGERPKHKRRISRSQLR
jgi:hypothetical protein